MTELNTCKQYTSCSDPVTYVLYGGAFDPPTPAHLRIIQELVNTYSKINHQIYIMVTDDGEKNYALDATGRLYLMQCALKQLSIPAFAAPVKTFIQTKRTAETIKAECPNAHVILVVGEDERASLVDRKEWVDSDWIINNCEIKTFPRTDGISSSKLRRAMQLDPLFVWAHTNEGYLNSQVALGILDQKFYNQANEHYTISEKTFIEEYKNKPKCKTMEILEQVKDGVITTEEAFAMLQKVDFPRPSVTATVIIHNASNNKYLLIRRKNPPFANFMAFPGGFSEPGDEDIETTAVREISEECGIDVEKSWLRPIKLYRADDPRCWAFDYFFVVTIFGKQASEVHAGDDAAEFVWATGDEIMKTKLAFHHKDAFERFYSKKNG